MNSIAFQIDAVDGHTIHGTHWSSTSTPVATLQIFHGLGEHHARYERFAAMATQHNFDVVCHDHRGHGAHTVEAGFFGQADGWDLLCRDARQVFEHIQPQHPDLPVILLGHSMGSYLAQTYAMRHSEDLAALILSASTWPEKTKTVPAHWLAKLERLRLGTHGKSALLHKLGFGDFNKPFEPARTPLDWLSRDEDEVDRYIADPLCGGPYTTNLWVEITGALRHIGSDSALRQIRSDLPLLLTGGTNDPVGGAKGMTALAQRYRQTGHDRLVVKLYEGGRHEMFNETNRDEFCDDILDWCSLLPGIRSTEA